MQQLRLDDVVADVEEIRGLIVEHGHSATNWWLGPSTRPIDLHERLLAAWAAPPRDGVADLAAMATTSAPAQPPPGVTVRPVATIEEMVEGLRIGWEALETPQDVRDLDLERRWRERQESDAAIEYIAFLDGEPVGHAVGVYCPRGCPLIGGATLPSARGRGAYRALVRARWDEAVRRGTPALAAQAVPTSEPILRRLGFEEVCRVRRLEDPA